MLNSTILLKVKQRLNKLDSSDFDNIEAWQIVEAFNKGQVEWCRRQIQGVNISKQGDEQSRRRVDDLQGILIESSLVVTARDIFYEAALPDNYFDYKTLDAMASTEECPKDRPLIIYQTEEVNVPILLRDENKKPSFDWAETFATLVKDRFRIYTNGEFTITSARALYYRQPTYIQIAGIADPYTNSISTVEVPSEFPDDVIEIMIDEAVSILSGDIESINQRSVADQNVNQNT
jgi:hypothetical protein